MIIPQTGIGHTTFWIGFFYSRKSNTTNGLIPAWICWFSVSSSFFFVCPGTRGETETARCTITHCDMHWTGGPYHTHTHKCPRGSALGTVKVHGAWVLGRKGVRWPGGWSWRQKVGRHACCCKLHVPFQGRYFQVYTVYTALRCCPLTMKRTKEIIQDTRMYACEVLHLPSRCQTSQSLCGNFPSFYGLSKLFCPSPGLAREGDFFVLLGRERRQNVRPDDGQLQDTTPYGVFE